MFRTFSDGGHFTADETAILRDICEAPLLSPEQEIAITERIVAHRKRLRTLLLLIPAVAQEVVHIMEDVFLSRGKARASCVVAKGDSSYSPQEWATVFAINHHTIKAIQESNARAFRPCIEAYFSHQPHSLEGDQADIFAQVRMHKENVVKLLEEIPVKPKVLFSITHLSGGHARSYIDELFEKAGEMERQSTVQEASANCSDFYGSLQETPEAFRTLVHDVRHAYQQYLQASQELSQANLRLVVNIAKRHGNRGLPLMDLINEGTLGLMHAIDMFDPRRKCKFSTYASWWICNYIFRTGLT